MTSSTRRLAAAAVTVPVIAATGCGSNDATVGDSNDAEPFITGEEAIAEIGVDLQLELVPIDPQPIRVRGASHTTANLSSIRLWDGTRYRQLGNNDPGATDKRSRLLWAFTDGTPLTIGPSLPWEGTILAPNADITIKRTLPIHGTIIGRTISGSATVVQQPPRSRHPTFLNR